MVDSLSQERNKGDPAPASAFHDGLSHFVFWVAAGGMLALDLWSKHRVFVTLAPDEVRPMIPGLIDLRRSLNDGAVFGTFTGQTGLFIAASLFALVFVVYLFARSASTQRSLHVALALILAGALGNLYDRAFVKADIVRFPARSGPPTTLIGRIVSKPDDPEVRIGGWPDGADVRSFNRSEVTIRRQGVVRDFVKFVPEFPAWLPRLGGRDVWPWVFNIADASLVCGVGLLLIHTWLDRKLRPTVR